MKEGIIDAIDMGKIYGGQFKKQALKPEEVLNDDQMGQAKMLASIFTWLNHVSKFVLEIGAVTFFVFSYINLISGTGFLDQIVNTILLILYGWYWIYKFREYLSYRGKINGKKE